MRHDLTPIVAQTHIASQPRLSSKPIAFLFLGETLLLPHLYPVVPALARLLPRQPIDLWVRHEETEGRLAALLGDGLGEVHIKRAPGFGKKLRKLVLLARLWPALQRSLAVVCAEQTSLWVPTLWPWAPPFFKTSHGVGSMSNRDDIRRRAARLLLVPSDLERDTYLRRGLDPRRVVATGYAKSAFPRQTAPTSLFTEKKPIVAYLPHWKKQRSSWWDWGRAIVSMLARQNRFNVILAPHQRLIERDPDVRAVLGSVANLPHVHVDLDSFAMVDGSYTAAADIYLGDTSSQVMEFLERARPCVFLNCQGIDWQRTSDHDFWHCGEVVTDLSDVMNAIDSAISDHEAYRRRQEEFAEASLGERGPCSAILAAEAIVGELVAYFDNVPRVSRQLDSWRRN